MVGRVTPCAPVFCVRTSGGQGTARPTNNVDFHADAEVAEPEVDDFTVGTVGGNSNIGEVGFYSDATPVETDAGDGGCSTAKERVEHQITFVRRGQQATFDQGHGLLSWVSAVGFLVTPRSRHGPDGT